MDSKVDDLDLKLTRLLQELSEKNVDSRTTSLYVQLYEDGTARIDGYFTFEMIEAVRDAMHDVLALRKPSS